MDQPASHAPTGGGPVPPKPAMPAPIPAAPVSMGSVPWRSVFRWARYVLGAAPVWVVLQTLLSLAVNVLNQYNMQVLATATSALSAALAGPAPAAQGGGGFIGALLPKDGA